MKKIFLLSVLILGLEVSYSQIQQTSYNFFQAKEWSKEIALFRSKAFVFNNVLDISSDVNTFTVIPLAAAKSGELTTLIYQSEEQKKEGLVLSFFGNYWNNEGVSFKGYGFKNLDKVKAIDFLKKIQKAMDDYDRFLKDNNDNNNIYFQYEDLKVLIYRDGNFVLRIFWNGFDSTWENTAYQRSKKRFLKKI